LGQKYDAGYKPEQYKYTITASELIPLSFDVLAHEIYTHEYNMNFSGNIVAPSDITASEKHPSDYIVSSDIKITNGAYSTNVPRRYMQIAANLETKNPLVTPQLQEITVKYKSSGATNTIKIRGNSALSTDPDGSKVAGFASNTWSQQAPLVRVKNDTNDTYNVLVGSDGTSLAHGQYQKTYGSAGDWEDGTDNSNSMNVRITPSGTLKLATDTINE
jgi:hypothetical protein